MSLIDNFLMFSKGERSYENLLNYLKSSFYTYRKDLHGLLLLLVREICDERAVGMMKKWASDREPSVRIGSIKCLLKLYEEGKLGLDQLEEFMTDPSPKVREALVSSLQRYCGTNKAEVRSFLSRMLAIERRSSIRTKIITALSETIEEKKHKEKRKGWICRLFRGG
ncbi:MAG: HEAT repeat domain-containing protein [Candidatus Korarchaeota archaeon]|nr:HEAT repeat domain-containing protein [Candidatus Korarchaeota archaeon]